MPPADTNGILKLTAENSATLLEHSPKSVELSLTGLAHEAGAVLAEGPPAADLVLHRPEPRRQLAQDRPGQPMHLVEPGQTFGLGSAPALPRAPSSAGRALLERAVRDLAHDCNAARGRGAARIDPESLREILLERAAAG